MIDEKLLMKYEMPTIERLTEVYKDDGETFAEIEYYKIFLQKTDYISNKLIESQVLGVTCEDYSEVLNARQFAREEINKLT